MLGLWLLGLSPLPGLLVRFPPDFPFVFGISGRMGAGEGDRPRAGSDMPASVMVRPRPRRRRSSAPRARRGGSS